MHARCYIISACCLALMSTVAVSGESVVEPTEMWLGKIKDKSLQTLAPKSGFITDAETWKKLRKAWPPKAELPKVNFNNDLIPVGTVFGPNLVFMQPTIADKGNVRYLVAGTRIGGPGFGYKIIRIGNNGVNTINGKPLQVKGVHGVLVIPKTVASFKEHSLEIKLWEYDPFLADAPAKLVDEFGVKKYNHKQGQVTKTSFSIGTKLQPQQNRRYYITAFVLQSGKRTHIGEKDGKRWLCNVLTQGNPLTVNLIIRPVR